MSKKHRGHAKGDPVTYQTPLPAGGVQMETFLPWTLVRRGLKKQVITPLDAPQAFLDEARRERQVREMAQDNPLMRALGLAHHWQRLMDEGRFESITEIAETEGLDLGRASRIARLAQLAPDIVNACVTGAAPALTLEAVSRRAIPADWDEQRRRYGQNRSNGTGAACTGS